MVLVLALGACGDEPEGFRCEPLIALPECPGCGPGEVRAGLSTERDRDLITATTDGGFLWSSQCEGVVEYDGTLAVRHDFGPERPYGRVIELLYGGPEQIYVGILESESPVDLELKAFGRITWSVDTSFADTIARPEGLYVGSRGYLAALSPSDGSVRWTREGLGDILTATAVASREGVVIADAQMVTELDTDGEQTWARPIAAQPIADVMALATSTGIVIVGSFASGTLDFGDVTLLGLADETMFIAELDPAGGTRWAHVLGGRRRVFPSSIATVGDRVVISGGYLGTVPQLGLPQSTDVDGFMAFVDATGAVARAFHGPGDQYVESVMPGLDGTVWMHFTNEPFAEGVVEVTIGSQTFAQSQLLVSLVP